MSGRESKNHALEFKPRREPYGMRRETLIAPIRGAVDQLLLRLKGAVEASCSGPSSQREDVSSPGAAQPEKCAALTTTLLVTGRRGAGKTTALLTARYALEHPKDFLESEGDRASLTQTELSDINKQIVWLEPLDLEPLPKHTNLLATLLVRIQQALTSMGHGHGHPSLLEEPVEDSWNKLDKLVRDAAFLWEEVSSGDPRTSADLAIKAAEIYAKFRAEFSTVIDGACKTLSEGRFGHEAGQSVILLLPIDNADRSGEHLHDIMKLIQMTPGRHLWYLVAAERSGFLTLLENAQQQETNTWAARLGGDTTLVANRRQAAAAVRKMFPPSHQIAIDHTAGNDALAFQRSDAKKLKEEQKLKNLLGELELAVRPVPKEPLKFYQLFDLEARLTQTVKTDIREALKEAGEHHKQQNDSLLSEAGIHTLDLPARNLVDLWEELNGHRTKLDHELAIQLTEGMLQSAIEESKLPSWAYTVFSDRIIQKNPHWNERVALNFSGMSIQRKFLRNSFERFELRQALEISETATYLRSRIDLNRFIGLHLRLKNPQRPDSYVTLPSYVEGWLIVLFDLLALLPEPRVVNYLPNQQEVNPRLAAAQHSFLVPPYRMIELELLWPTPAWATFIDSELLIQQWQGFLHRYKCLVLGCHELMGATERLRFVRAAWIANVCSVAGQLGEWDYREAFDRVLISSSAIDGVEAYERKALNEVERLYEAGKDAPPDDDRAVAARSWIEDELPLLFTPELFPLPQPELLLSLEPWRCVPNAPSKLCELWSDPVHLTILRQKLVRSAIEKSAPGSETQLDQACAVWFATIAKRFPQFPAPRWEVPR